MSGVIGFVFLFRHRCVARCFAGKPAVHQMSSEGAFLKSDAMDVWCQSIASTSGNVFL